MWIILFPSIINSFVASNFPVGPVDRGRALDVVVVNQKKGSLPWIYFPAAHRVTIVHNFGDKFRLLNWSAQKQTRTDPSGYRIIHSSHSQLIQKTEEYGFKMLRTAFILNVLPCQLCSYTNNLHIKEYFIVRVRNKHYHFVQFDVLRGTGFIVSLLLSVYYARSWQLVALTAAHECVWIKGVLCHQPPPTDADPCLRMERQSNWFAVMVVGTGSIAREAQYSKINPTGTKKPNHIKETTRWHLNRLIQNPFQGTRMSLFLFWLWPK